MNNSIKGLALLGGMVALGSSIWCGPALAAPVTGPTPPTVRVTNTRSVPVVVYLERGPFDSRLGTVPPNSESVLELPELVKTEKAVQFVVHPEGAHDLLSQYLELEPGKSVDLYVPTNDVGFLPAPPPEVIPNPGKGTTTLTVENPRDEDVVVFVEKGDFDMRIGTVQGRGEETFHLEDLIALQQHQIRIILHPEAGVDLDTQEFQLTPEAHLFLKVPAR